MNPAYAQLAAQAVANERAGKGVDAHKLWNKASRLAKNTANQGWAAARAEFCLNSRFVHVRERVA
ncbi:ANR family transcriptional regulator [Acerihabitans sp. KWT182]|uniref:ANR family transcriptional regulator n=1 Tax=Acerihabitans sp. KWT182 TaxID=3157919 RepID=A0AAU7QDK7_9GAMM